jgi:hypothetical protein
MKINPKDINNTVIPAYGDSDTARDERTKGKKER